ncbi:hypothetical protein GCM10027447_01920 [Glycomyces halotolerans]
MADLKMRLTGLEQEVAAVVALLREDPAFLSASPPYPNRGDDKRVRVYLEFDGADLAAANPLDPTRSE